MSNPTTKAAFDYFTKRVYHWAKVLGLSDWRFVVRHERAMARACAATAANMKGRVATVCLSPEWQKDPITKERLDSVALHEAAEVLLWELSLMALGRPTHEAAVEEEVHIIIRRLECAFCEEAPDVGA